MNPNTKLSNYTIYIILQSISKEFYIHYCQTSALTNTMKTHYTFQISYTENMFRQYKNTSTPPEMYSIQSGIMSLEKCYSAKIIWIKYFIEQGYKSLNHIDDINASENLFENTQKRYSEIHNIPLNNIINQTTHLFPNYGTKKNTNESNTKQINIRVSPEEYTLIKNNAKAHDKTLTAFIKEVAINQVIIDYNYDAIIKHTEVINKLRAESNLIIRMLIKTNQAYPADIEKMISLLEEISKNEKRILNKTQREREEIKSYINKLLAKPVEGVK